MAKNQNFDKKLKVWPKTELFENRNVRPKAKFWSKIEIWQNKSNVGRKSKFWSKISILFRKNGIFPKKSKFSQNGWCGNNYVCFEYYLFLLVEHNLFLEWHFMLIQKFCVIILTPQGCPGTWKNYIIFLRIFFLKFTRLHKYRPVKYSIEFEEVFPSHGKMKIS